MNRPQREVFEVVDVGVEAVLVTRTGTDDTNATTERMGKVRIVA